MDYIAWVYGTADTAVQHNAVETAKWRKVIQAAKIRFD
jgi:hypothetical protein